MIKTRFDYIDDIYDEVSKSIKVKDRFTKKDVERVLERIESTMGLIVRRGWMMDTGLILKPYTGRKYQYLLYGLYMKQKILKQQITYNRYERKTKI